MGEGLTEDTKTGILYFKIGDFNRCCAILGVLWFSPAPQNRDTKKTPTKNKNKKMKKKAMKNCLDTLGSGLCSRQTADGRRGGRAR